MCKNCDVFNRICPTTITCSASDVGITGIVDDVCMDGMPGALLVW